MIRVLSDEKNLLFYPYRKITPGFYYIIEFGLCDFGYRLKNRRVVGGSNMKIGFDNNKYLERQSQHIRDRIEQFGDKLYLEFGGKLFDDYHASRVLPGFKPDSKLQMLMQLKDEAEIVIVINAADIEKQNTDIREASPAGAIVLDCEDLAYISSAGLRIILRLSTADDLIPTFLPHQIVLSQEFVFFLVIAAMDGKECQYENGCGQHPTPDA